ncbi:ABC transporter permease [Brucepastera parasyntrophica]|uniref:ABC transporter permease n=1 Tax=Brucepastera parasyntrophica TaxID=2880008 RepID=UPI00210E81D9|nr:ABC transporter permease [Brucepastera parasyntrophica]ULQ60303.1 ABC transporter permease [Brucepastera parasyntrophica]
MSPYILLKSSFRSIFRNRMRSLLTSLGIIIGVGSVIVMVAIGQGSQSQIEAQLSAMGTNLLVVMPMRGPGRANRLTKADVTKLRNEASYISAISGISQRSFTVVGGETNWDTTVMGVDPDYLTIKNWKIKDGSFFEESDLASRNKVAVLGTTVATKLYGNSDPVGQSIRIGTQHFKIIGILDSKGASGMGNDDDDVIMVPLDTAMTRLNQTQTLNNIQISVVREDYMEQAQKETEAILRESHKLSSSAAADFDIMNMADVIATASQTSKTLTTLLAAIAGVSLLVGGIGIMNIMLVSVTERTREIGIRMSVGARKRDILLQFLSESIILSLMGGIIGILLAYGICSVLSFFSIATVVNPIIIAIAALFAAVVGIFFGYYPARKAARLYPIDALRYE